MFDILFGWRKASKCKKLIRRLQRRLKLLKNKRSIIVRQLRDDVAELLKHGHGQTAFDRVEELFKDECLLAVYDLLEKFSEFIISNLHYIRRNKDCPNDINEAVSSLIFASARFGDLPELISIRKLFGKRYGQRLVTVALELLPGNLVNRQMREKMCIKPVSNEEKSKLLEEILKSSLQSGPLLLEYSSELQQESQENDSKFEPTFGSESLDVPNDGDNSKFSNMEEEVKAIVAILNSALPSTFPTPAQKAHPDTMSLSVHKENEGIATSVEEVRSCHVDASDVEQLDRSLILYDSTLTHEEMMNAAVESSSETSAQLPEEIVYLDDIQEFESKQSKEGNLQDQRLFKFRSSAVLIRGKTDISRKEAANPDQGKEDLHDQKSDSRRKNRRFRRRSISGDATSINDLECAIYYGESCENSPNYDLRSHDLRQKNCRKIPIDHQAKSYYIEEVLNDPSVIKLKSSSCFTNHHDTLHSCSLDHPCYSCTYNEKPTRIHVNLISHHCCASCEKNPPSLEEESGVVLNQKAKNSEGATSPALLISTCSGSSCSSTSIEYKPSYARAMTMPPERSKSNKDASIEAVIRSNSFPFREHDNNRHVHPNLPDYDEFAATFIALKKANLQRAKTEAFG